MTGGDAISRTRFGKHFEKCMYVASVGKINTTLAAVR